MNEMENKKQGGRYGWKNATKDLAYIAVFAALTLGYALLYKRLDAGRRKNADRVLGAVARVTEAIDNAVPVGAVYVDGKTWSARSVSGEPVAVGAMVRVKRMEGVRLFVEEVKEEA